MQRYDQIMQQLEGHIVCAENNCPPLVLTEEQLQRIEEAIGHPLPQDYREFLKYYGGYYVDAVFPVVGQKFWGSTQIFYGLMPKEPRRTNSAYPLYPLSYDLLYQHSAMGQNKPDELLCIADNGAGVMSVLRLPGSALVQCGIGILQKLGKLKITPVFTLLLTPLKVSSIY